MSARTPVDPSHKEGGFTLVETVIALALTAFLTSAAVGLVVQARRASMSVGVVTQQAQDLLYMQSILRSDLAAIHPPIPQVSAGQTPVDQSREVVLLSFTREGWPNSELSEARTSSVRVEYQFQGNALIRRVWLSDAPNSQTPYVDRVLYEGIADAKVNFRSGGVWNPSWPALDVSLPKALILRLDLESGERLELTVNIAHGA